MIVHVCCVTKQCLMKKLHIFFQVYATLENTSPLLIHVFDFIVIISCSSIKQVNEKSTSVHNILMLASFLTSFAVKFSNFSISSARNFEFSLKFFCFLVNSVCRNYMQFRFNAALNLLNTSFHTDIINLIIVKTLCIKLIKT